MDINGLNIEMLHSLNSDWDFLTPIQPADVDTLCKNGYLQRAVDLLQANFRRKSIWLQRSASGKTVAVLERGLYSGTDER